MSSAEYYDRLMNGLEELPFPLEEGMRIISEMGYTETYESHDWVPFSEIYRRYKAANPRTILPPIAFGFAIRLACPSGERVSRRYQGKTVRGWSGIVGPGALRTDERY